MKVHAYRVQQNGARGLPELGALIHARAIDDRIFPGGDTGFRLEDYEHRHGYYLFDFAKPRSGHGPSRMSARRPMAHFDLDEDETFGEDTALIYHPASGYAATQYNHYGPRISAIERYLNAADLAFGIARGADRWGYEFGAYLRQDAYERLQDFGLVQEIDFTISVPGVLASDLDRGRSLGGILNGPLPQGLETISITMRAQAGRSSALGHDGAWSIINDIRRLGGEVFNAKIRGKPAARQRKQEVDLIEEQLTAHRNITPGRGNRIARQERWAALVEVLHEWISTQQIT